jgi:hypothetical protein
MNESSEVLVNGFTYSGQALHIVINYLLIFICLLPHWMAKGQEKKILGKYWIGVLVIMLVLQIWVWFEENATGVSLIWSALAGLNILLLVKTRHFPEEVRPLIRQLLWASLLSVLVANIYYWFTFPTITTIAHLIGVFVGMAIYGALLLISRLMKKH